MKCGTRLAALAIGTIAGVSLTSGCETSGDDGAAVEDGSRRGELIIYQADNFETGASQFTYTLRDATGAELPLHFDTRPGLEGGTKIKAWGVPEGDGLRVTSFSPIPDPVSTIQSGLIGAAPFPARTFAFVLVDIGGGITPVRWDNTMNDLTETFVMGRLITDDDSLRNYYLGDSYQMQDISAKVAGPFSYPLSSSCDTSQLTSTLKPMVDAQVGATSQNYLWFFGSQTSSCGWSGLASVGTPQRPSANTWYNHSVGCVVLVQEPGHNFGMQHSSSLKCGTSNMLDDPNSGCTASEYGDSFDPMGGGCRHMNAWQKSYQGWLSSCNGVRVTNSGTFNLLPLEMACNGTQFLQIKAPHARPFMRPAAGGGGATTENLDYYYLELRTPVDFDGTLGGSALSARVLVHMATDLQPRTGKGFHTFLLDMAPSTSSFNDAALPVGQTYTDPAGGLSFTVQAVSNSGATIVVNYASGGSGDPTCMDGSAFTAPGPTVDTSCSGTPVSTGAGGATGTGGRGGTTGTAGAGGRGGTTGSAGTTGNAGRGGTTGSAGRGGTTGAAGTGGSGTAGETGAAGAPMPVGAGGSTGAGGDTNVPMDRGVSGGCACDTAGSGSTAGLASALLLALGFAVTFARPRVRAPRTRVPRVRA
jgi:Gametolysin peptidase M11